MSKYFKAYETGKAAWKALTGGSKVSPTITKVKPNLKKTIQQSRSDEYSKRSKKLRDAQDKIKKGKEMMKEGQKVRKGMVDTGTAFQFKNRKTWHPLQPGDKKKYKIKKGVAGGD